MQLTVGSVVEGKITGITNFGAFVELEGKKTGMVHISEVANTYVSDIRTFLTEGQDVKVMVISLDNGKINLSMKRLEPKPQRDNNAGRPNFREGGRAPANREGNAGGNRAPRPAAPAAPPAPKTADQLFEEKLKQFMSESDNKISSIRQYSDHRTKSRRR